MRLTLSLFCLITCTISGITLLQAQRNNPFFTITNGPLYSGEALDVFDLRDRQTEIENYWFDDWRNGGIMLKDSQVVKGFPLRYNRFSRNIEIRTVGDIKVLPDNKIDLAFLVANGDTSFFVDLTYYLGLPRNPAFSGLSRLLFDGKFVVFHRKEGELLKSNYVPALDAGYENDRIVFEDAFYLYDGVSIERLPANRKRLIKFLEAKGLEVEAYIKSERIKGKTPEDLIKLFQYIEENS